MEFDVSTFVLEIFNFLILVWILQRFFYRPVLAVIARRRQQIDESLSDAKRLHQEAEALRNLYENRQKLWEQEKQAALSALTQQIETQRSEQLNKLRAELEQERQKAEVTLSRQQQDFQRQVEKQALLNGARFAGLLLRLTAGPQLEARLFSMLIERIDDLPEACRVYNPEMLDQQTDGLQIIVASAYPLPSNSRRQLEQRLTAVIDGSLSFQYQQDSELISGIRIDIGAWVLHANLKHELAGFAELAYESE
ncbi:MAG: F0F1 ATP synthase subunit delta [Gammaproteobacteria bacterium]